MKKRLLSLSLALLIVVALVPAVPAQAAGAGLIDAEIDLHGLSYGSYDSYVASSGSGSQKRYSSSSLSNFTSPDIAAYYIDGSGNLCVVIADITLDSTGRLTEKYSQKFWIFRYNQNYVLIDKKEIATPNGFPLWGGFHAGSDGYFYVAVGCDNSEESTTKTVIQILRYDRDWKHTGTGSVSGKPRSDSRGIENPFSAGNCSMLVKDGVLYVHSSRRQFKSSDGLKHQVNISFYIDTNTMQFIDSNPQFFVSHSFQQLIATDGNRVYYVDHGDGNPRGVCLQSTLPVSLSGLSANHEYKRNVLFDLLGNTGENYTGTTAGTLDVARNSILVTGSSVPHSNAVSGKTGYNYQGSTPKVYCRNIYLITASKDNSNYDFKWITTYDPEGNVSVESPRTVKIDENTFVVLFNVIVYGDGRDFLAIKERAFHAVVIDGSGNVKNRVSYPDVYFADNSKPILYNGDIVWVSPKEKNMQPKANYIYRLPCDEVLGLTPPSPAFTEPAPTTPIVTADGFVFENSVFNSVLVKYNGTGGAVTIPNGTTKIAERAFAGCIELNSVTIPNSVTEIGSWAFYDCLSLKDVTIPDSVAKIGTSAFSGMQQVSTAIVMGEEVPFWSTAPIKGLTIYGSVGSEAEKYAKENEITFIAGTAPGATTPTPSNTLDTAADWAKAGITSAIGKGFVPADIQDNYKNTITRAEFCRMAIKWLEYKTGKGIDTILTEQGKSRRQDAFADTADKDILAAYALGITNGTTAPTADKSGVFTPNGQFTREQAATMIMNTCRAAGMDVSKTTNAGFTDIGTASPWAVDGINFVRNNEIMGGTSTTALVFSPKGIYTRQESIMTFNNIK
ncbi:MAG: leucine-rich repeat domain-containing protein [Oscillospiraceae bacterium]|jgi:hypothetical protein|nr:leucine-rich repeat domain-containing protein [Oscillospiraceae bacterium]